MHIERMIRQYLNQNVLFGDESITYDDDTSFLAAGILDSMAVLELVAWIETTFNIKTEVRDLTPDNFDSVARLAKYISNQIPAAALRAESVGTPAAQPILAPQA